MLGALTSLTGGGGMSLEMSNSSEAKSQASFDNGDFSYKSASGASSAGGGMNMTQIAMFAGAALVVYLIAKKM